MEKKIDRRGYKSYDYQKHEYSRNLSRSKSFKKRKVNVSENYSNILKTDEKQRSSIHGRKKINFDEIDKNKLYEDMYKKNVKQLDNLFGKNNNLEKEDKNENIGDVSRFTEEESIYHEPIEYGKAIDLLHNALYSINLEQDSGEEEEE